MTPSRCHTPPDARRPARHRRIGPAGTAARVAVGGAMFGSVVHGHASGPFRPLPWIIGLVAFPALALGWQRWRTRRNPGRMEATGPVPHVLNVAIFFALYLMPDHVPVLWATSDAALVFYGLSMLVAAARGYGGCEVLAISNWLLRRDDQVGCLVFAPVDHLDVRRPPVVSEGGRR